MLLLLGFGDHIHHGRVANTPTAVLHIICTISMCITSLRLNNFSGGIRRLFKSFQTSGIASKPQTSSSTSTSQFRDIYIWGKHNENLHLHWVSEGFLPSQPAAHRLRFSLLMVFWVFALIVTEPVLKMKPTCHLAVFLIKTQQLRKWDMRKPVLFCRIVVL